MIRVLLADSQLLIREGIRSLLANYEDIEIVGEVTNGKELITSIKMHKPDVIIIDYDLPGHFEMNDIAKIYRHFPNMKVLVVTANNNSPDILKVLEYGVNNYILKECDRNEILEALTAASKGERFFCRKVVDAIFDRHFQKNKPGPSTELSDREREIVTMIAEGSTSRDIATQLFLSVHTVNTHRKNILRKLDLKNPTELVMYAIKNELVDPHIKQKSQS